MDRKLHRSRQNRYIGGVCGGLGEYFDIDPTLVRLIAIVLTLASVGVGLLAYIAAWIIVPNVPADYVQVESPRRYPSWCRYLPGLILVVIGAIMLVQEFYFWFGWHEIGPIVLILLGLVLLLYRKSPKHQDEVTRLGEESKS
jgi:phage shock protein C